MTRQPRGNDDGEPPKHQNHGTQQLLSRLDKRRQDGESRDDVVLRLLDETIEEVPIETVIDEIFDHFDHIAGITVNHPIPEKPSAVHVTVFTGEASGFEETVPLYDTGRSRAVLHNDEQERFVLPFEVIATASGPEGQGMITKTPVYIADTVIGAEPLSVEDGLSRLQSKIGKSTDEIRTMLRNEREDPAP